MWLIGIFEFMIVNDRQAWNMSTKTKMDCLKYDKRYISIGLDDKNTTKQTHCKTNNDADEISITNLLDIW